MSRTLRSPFAALLPVAFATAGACSTFDPAVGGLQVADSGAPSACALPSNGYAASFGSPQGQAAVDAICSPDGGSLEGPCDACEAVSCCAERVACYSDHACSCADEGVDACLSAAPDSGAAAATATLACWGTFAASGTIAQTRYACLQKWCAVACQIPS